tara:strand:- start:19 stop:198 length:180 start_codon:yes stop_codon:yes gene_type:complete
MKTEDFIDLRLAELHDELKTLESRELDLGIGVCLYNKRVQTIKMEISRWENFMVYLKIV